jgi:hypothetical protein
MHAPTNAPEMRDLVARLVNGTVSRPRGGSWTSGPYLSTFDSKNPATAWLSNFYPSPIKIIDDVVTSTAEHFYHLLKVLLLSYQTSPHLPTYLNSL